MRAAGHGDVLAAARVLCRTLPSRRDWVLRRIIREADLAQGRVRRGLPGHPLWGDGSLMSAALRRRPEAAPTLQDKGYCLALALVYRVLAARAGQPELQPTQVAAAGSRLSLRAGISSPQT